MPPFSVDPNIDTICDVARRWAEVQPDAPALLKESAAPITYSDIVQSMDRLGAALRTSGLSSGARIGLIHSGAADMGALLMGIMDYGAVAPLSPTLNVRELAVQIDARRIDGLVVEAALETDARDAAGQCGVPVYDVQSDISGVGFTAGSGTGQGARAGSGRAHGLATSCPGGEQFDLRAGI